VNVVLFLSKEKDTHLEFFKLLLTLFKVINLSKLILLICLQTIWKRLLMKSANL